MDRRWITLAVFVPVAAIVDQVTKQIVETSLAPRGMIPVIDGFFTLHYARNRGAFFSLGENLDPSIRRIFFVVATLAAGALIVHLYRKATASQRILRLALLLLLSGALGNLIDRVLYGEVIDFLHLYYDDVFDWATFNVADIYITAGLILLVVDLVRSRPKAASTPVESP